MRRCWPNVDFSSLCQSLAHHERSGALSAPQNIFAEMESMLDIERSPRYSHMES
jgi:hypothetical protein